MLDLS